MPSLDTKLLNQTSAEKKQTEEDQQAAAGREGDLREAQNGESNQASPNDQADDFNANRQQSKKEKKQKESDKSREVVPEKSLSAGTSKLLVAAWRNIIPTWGFSFFYVYAHLFLANVFGNKLFAPLGSEWFDKPGNPMAARDQLGKKLKLPEMMLVLLVSLIIFFAIISFFSIIALIVEVVKNPIRSVLGNMLDGVWSFLSANK